MPDAATSRGKMTNTPFAPLGAAARSLLVAGNPVLYSTEAGLAQGFRELGWDVDEVSSHDAFITSRELALRVAGRATQSLAAAAYNRAVLAHAAEFKPDVMLTGKGMFLMPDTIRELRRQRIFTVNFYTDYKFEYPGFDETWLSEYDLVATTKSFQVDYLADRIGADRVALVHHGYVPYMHRRRVPAGEIPHYLWEVAFVGNASENKLAWLSDVARAMPDLSMIIVGNGWRKLASGTPVEPFVFGHPLRGDHFARIAEHSQINLAVHHGDIGSKHGWQDLVSTRTFEIPASGGFMLHIDNDEVRTLYEPGREIDVFSGTDDLIAKLRHHLAHPEERRAIAERGHARATPAYSLSSRAHELAALIDQRRH